MKKTWNKYFAIPLLMALGGLAACSTDTVADDATAEYMQSYMEENILSAFSDDFNSSDLVQEAARAGYTFRYRGVDQNGRQIYNVKLTPTDYAPLLR